jgi:hypothetical protein
VDELVQDLFKQEWVYIHDHLYGNYQTPTKKQLKKIVLDKLKRRMQFEHRIDIEHRIKAGSLQARIKKPT